MSIKNGITDPRDPMTFPYRTTLNFSCFDPSILLAATNNLSLHNLVAPYRFIGAAALSVLKAITFLTSVSIHALIRLSAPITFSL